MQTEKILGQGCDRWALTNSQWRDLAKLAKARNKELIVSTKISIFSITRMRAEALIHAGVAKWVSTGMDLIVATEHGLGIVSKFGLDGR